MTRLRITAVAALVGTWACGGGTGGPVSPGQGGGPTRIVFQDPGTGPPNDLVGPFEDSVPVAPGGRYLVRAVPMDAAGTAYNQLTLDWAVAGGGSLDHAVTSPAGGGDATLNAWSIGVKEGVESLTVTLPAYPAVQGRLHVQALFLHGVAVSPSGASLLTVAPREQMSLTAQIQTGTGKPFPWSVTFVTTYVPSYPCNNMGVAGGFAATSSAPAGPATFTTPTDGQGNATVVYTGPPNYLGAAGCQISINAVPAVSPGGIENLGAPANWLANVIQAMPAQVVPLGGGDQVTTPGSTLPIPLVALVEDSFGSPIPGVTVSWSASSGGTVSPASTVTDAVGEAAASWTVGPASGSQTATATTTPGGFSATFTATVL